MSNDTDIESQKVVSLARYREQSKPRHLTENMAEVRRLLISVFESLGEPVPKYLDELGSENCSCEEPQLLHEPTHHEKSRRLLCQLHESLGMQIPTDMRDPT